MLMKKSDESALVKHWRIHHGDREDAPRYSFSLVGRHKTATERQLKEALMIEDENPDSLMNSKTEYGRNSVVRQTVQFDGRQFGGDRVNNTVLEASRDRGRCRQRETDAAQTVTPRDTLGDSRQINQPLTDKAQFPVLSSYVSQTDPETNRNNKRRKMMSKPKEIVFASNDIRCWTKPSNV